MDDEEIIRKTAKSMLERYGFAVVVAEDGQQGNSAALPVPACELSRQAQACRLPRSCTKRT